MEPLKCPVTISASTDDDALSETVEAWVDERPGFALFPGRLLRRLGIEPDLPLIITATDGTHAVVDSCSARLTIEGHTGRGVVIFGGDDEVPRVTNITLFGLCLKVDPVDNRLVKRLPLMKPPGWYEEQRLLKEWVERNWPESRS